MVEPIKPAPPVTRAFFMSGIRLLPAGVKMRYAILAHFKNVPATRARKPYVCEAHCVQEKPRALAKALCAHRVRPSASLTSVCSAEAVSSTDSGSKYTPASPRMLGMGSRREQAIGKPAAIASRRMLGMFSQEEAKTN